MSQPAELLQLKQALEQRFPHALPVSYRTAGAVATGVAALDHMLPANGLPRGRLSVWQPGGGATAILYAACEAIAERGERAAWIDAAGTIAGDSWRAGPLLLKPEGELESLICAEELLRCGAFGLIVLSGARAAFQREAVRLSRAVREGGGAFVALADHSNVAHLQIASRIDPASYRWQRNPFGEPAHVTEVRVQVEAQAMGWGGRTQVVLPVTDFAQRTASAAELVDRRGAQHKVLQRPVPPTRAPVVVTEHGQLRESKIFRATSY
ncbi:MAG TPA: hypothetical protein VFO52_12715 [Longimicrobiales bacterium]|nr:hypothetical protein [Longimicrobiales bacterium]